MYSTVARHILSIRQGGGWFKEHSYRSLDCIVQVLVTAPEHVEVFAELTIMRVNCDDFEFLVSDLLIVDAAILYHGPSLIIQRNT